MSHLLVLLIAACSGILPAVVPRLLAEFRGRHVARGREIPRHVGLHGHIPHRVEPEER